MKPFLAPQKGHSAPFDTRSWLLAAAGLLLLAVLAWQAGLAERLQWSAGPLGLQVHLYVGDLRTSASGSGAAPDPCSGAAAAAGGALPPLVAYECPRVQAMIASKLNNVEKKLEPCSAANVTALVATVARRAEGAEFLGLRPCDLFRLISGRTLWVFGDSQSRLLFRHMQCFLEPFLEALPPDRSGEQDGGDDVVCTHLVQRTRICKKAANRGGLLVSSVLPRLEQNATAADLVLVNVGLWHHKDEDVPYEAYLRRLADHYRARRARLPRLLWLSTSPQHWEGPTGEYPSPKIVDQMLGDPSKRRCVPIQGAYLRADGTLWGDNAEVLAGGWRNAAAKPILKEAGIPYIDIWNASVPFWFMHKRSQMIECTHSCMQMYGLWTWQVYRALRDLG